MWRLLIAVACIYAFMVVCGILVYLFDKLVVKLQKRRKEKDV